MKRGCCTPTPELHISKVNLCKSLPFHKRSLPEDWLNLYTVGLTKPSKVGATEIQTEPRLVGNQGLFQSAKRIQNNCSCRQSRLGDQTPTTETSVVGAEFWITERNSWRAWRSEESGHLASKLSKWQDYSEKHSPLVKTFPPQTGKKRYHKAPQTAVLENK